MIFGMTITEREIRLNQWRKTFALLPKRLYDGRWAWLRTLEVVGYAGDEAHPDDRTDWFWSYWVYRLPSSNKREYFSR